MTATIRSISTLDVPSPAQRAPVTSLRRAQDIAQRTLNGWLCGDPVRQMLEICWELEGHAKTPGIRPQEFRTVRKALAVKTFDTALRAMCAAGEKDHRWALNALYAVLPHFTQAQMDLFESDGMPLATLAWVLMTCDVTTAQGYLGPKTARYAKPLDHVAGYTTTREITWMSAYKMKRLKALRELAPSLVRFDPRLTALAGQADTLLPALEKYHLATLPYLRHRVAVGDRDAKDLNAIVVREDGTEVDEYGPPWTARVNVESVPEETEPTTIQRIVELHAAAD